MKGLHLVDCLGPQRVALMVEKTARRTVGSLADTKAGTMAELRESSKAAK